MRSAIICVLALAFTPGRVLAQSHPILFTTSAREAVWAQMKTDYNANVASPATIGGRFYKYLHDKALTASDPNGFQDTIMYHMTGTSTYASHAYTTLTSTFFNLTTSTLCQDPLREYGWQWVWMYDWLYPGLDAGQRTTFLNKLKDVNLTCTIGASLRITDTDLSFGQYMSFALLNAAVGGYDSAVSTAWADTNRKLGGYDSTGSNGATFRNCLFRYVDSFAQGGQWMEGDRYNQNTIKIAVLGAEGIKTATGVDHYPEITDYIPQAAEDAVHNLAPNLNEPLDWGDNEDPGLPFWYYRLEVMMMLSGMAQGTTQGQRLQDFVNEVITTKGGFDSLRPYSRAFLVWNPYATTSNWRDTSLNHFATSQGILSSRTAWDSGASWFWAQFKRHDAMKAAAVYPETGDASHDEPTDHPPQYHGLWQLWKNGKWVFRPPHCYGGPCMDSRSTNGLTLGGLPVLYTPYLEYRAKNTAYKVDGDYTYIVSTAGGSTQFSGEYGGLDPISIQEHTRSIVWLPGDDVVVVCDRANSKNPLTIGYSHYKSPVRTYLASVPAVKQFWIHSPISPTLGSGYVEWQYAAGEYARVTTLSPSDLNRVIEDENVVWDANYYQVGYWAAGDKRYHVRLTPQSERQWDVFLNVYQSHSGTPAVVTLVSDTANNASAALIATAAHNRLLTFNATQGPNLTDPYLSNIQYGYYATGSVNAAVLDTVHFRKTGFTLSFAAGSNPTKVILFDLDPGTVWTYKINGGSAAALSVGAEGSAKIDTGATGSVTLDILAGGAQSPPPVIVTTATLPDGRLTAAYSQTLTATGGNNGPYTWTKTAGSLPTSLSLSHGGVISGTPTAASTFSFTVQACDSTPTSGTRALQIIVRDVPSISGDYNNGSVGVAYSDGITTTGGTAPYVYTLTGGGMCGGLTLGADGVISGTPTMVEICSFEVTVTDDGALTDAVGFEIHISNIPVLPSLAVRSEPSNNGVVVHFSSPGLVSTDVCTVDILNGQTTVASNTTNTGRALRTISFTNLLAGTIYGIDVLCGQIHSMRVYFVTGLATIDTTVDYVFHYAPSAILQALGAVKISVTAESESGGPTLSVTDRGCSPSCDVTFSFVRGDRYSIFYSWESAGNAQLASSKIGMLIAVP